MMAMVRASASEGVRPVHLDVSPQILAYAAFVAEMVEIDVPPVDFRTWVDVRDRMAFVASTLGPFGPATYQVLATNWDGPEFALDVLAEFEVDPRQPEAAEKAARKLARSFFEDQGAEG